MKLSVVIPTHDRRDKLALTLERLAKQSVRYDWEAIIVANNCQDDTVDMVENLATTFPVSLRAISESTPGAAAARNAGARAARAGDILFLDDDILVEPDCLARVLSDRHLYPGAWLLGQALPLPEHRATPFGKFRASRVPESPDVPVAPVTWFSSNLVVIPAAALFELGGYEETFPTAALEDADIAIRAHQAGHTVLFDPALRTLHNDWAGTTLRAYCSRERTHCSTAPLLYQRFGAEGHPWSRLIVENQPVSATDPIGLLLKKVVKLVLSRQSVQTGLVALAERLENTRHANALLPPVYRLSIAGAMYRGYQDGVRMFATSSVDLSATQRLYPD